MTRWTPRRPRPRLLCVVCREDDLFFDVTPVACVHAYCRHCVQDLFRRSFKDESLFPPRCCGQPILPGSIRFFLTAEIVEQYEEARVEFSDPDRAYCSLPTCSSYIRRENIVAGQATCPPCTTQSCSFCKKEWHEGDCPADNNLQLVLATAAAQGWKRCSNCRTMVEHTLGCNHMTFVFTSPSV
jgi:hypothetical protein